MKILLRKELEFYLNNPIGYIVITLFGVFANFLYVKDVFLTGSASLRPFFDILPWLLMIFIPAICMRLVSEERRTNTLEVLLTLPVSEIQIIIAKFLAALALTFVGLTLTIGLPLSMYLLTSDAGGRIHLPEIIVGYAGVLLMASGFIAISLYFSSRTKNQIIAFLAAVVSIFFLVIFSTDFAASVLPYAVQSVLNYLSPVTQVAPFVRGVVDVRGVLYFVSTATLFLFLTVIDIEKRP